MALPLRQALIPELNLYEFLRFSILTGNILSFRSKLHGDAPALNIRAFHDQCAAQFSQMFLG
jgi:hypothetical protein